MWSSFTGARLVVDSERPNDRSAAVRGDASEPAARLLEIVGALVEELHPGQPVGRLVSLFSVAATITQVPGSIQEPGQALIIAL
jgi:hypothetical protein